MKVNSGPMDNEFFFLKSTLYLYNAVFSISHVKFKF